MLTEQKCYHLFYLDHTKSNFEFAVIILHKAQYKACNDKYILLIVIACIQ